MQREKKNTSKKFEKVTKSAWGMPWLSEAKKDVISCDKPRGGANDLRSGDFRMGQPTVQRCMVPTNVGAHAGN